MADTKKLLIAEDDPFLIKVAGITLEKSGYQVDRAKDGNEALDMIKKNHYDLVLLDMIMPHKTGFEVLRELKGEKNMPPVLVFSNLAQDSDKKEAMDLGAKGYYVKSNIALNELVDIIKKELG